MNDPNRKLLHSFKRYFFLLLLLQLKSMIVYIVYIMIVQLCRKKQKNINFQNNMHELQLTLPLPTGWLHSYANSFISRENLNILI